MVLVLETREILIFVGGWWGWWGREGDVLNNRSKSEKSVKYIFLATSTDNDNSTISLQ